MKKYISLNRDQITAVLMLLPSLILIAVFVYGFIFQTAYSSFTDWSGMAKELDLNFVGLENYRNLFTKLQDIRFRQSLVNTLFFTVFFIAGSLSLGLLFAILLDQNIRFEGAFRLIFLYPMSLSFIVSGTAWRWLLNPKGGINLLPTLIGREPLDILWLTDRTQIWQFDWLLLPKYAGYLLLVVMVVLSIRYFIQKKNRGAIATAVVGILTLVWLLSGGANKVPVPGFPELHGFNLALIGIVLAATWQMSGYMMAMYIAGIRGIPEELREAARVDGANELQIYFDIIFPMLKPITLSAMIVLGHISLKIFDLIFVMVGPDNATTDVPGVLMFLTAFRGNQFAKGAAIAMVMLLIVAVVIVPYLVNTLRTEQEL